MSSPVPVSPLAPTSYPFLPEVPGVTFSTAEAGIRYQGRTDVLLVLLSKGTHVAGVFTTSKCPSAPVDWCREKLKKGKARALIVNSGNANAFTGKAGAKSVKTTAQLLAHAASIPEEEIFIASTGVIGEPLDAGKFEPILPSLVASATPFGMLESAKAMMTTDTYPKIATQTALIDGIPVILNGMAKGAGMMAPDMATLLSFLFTDAPIAASVLQKLLSKGVKHSFNAITIDSDTSTSDSVLFFATGTAATRGVPKITKADDPRLKDFREKLDKLLLHLAHQVVRDGEGCRKFVEICVQGAASDKAAHRIALSIANSPLVKTAIAGEDANWGRIVAAVGKSGEKADRDHLSIWFGDVRVATKGHRDPEYDESLLSRMMKEEAIFIRVDVGIGEGRAKVWTCDLTQAYVAINGDYRS